jgi:hypothetical protein
VRAPITSVHILHKSLLPVLVADGYIEHGALGLYPWMNSASNLLMSWARVGRTSDMYIIRHSGMSNPEASLGDILMPSMHCMEFAFCRLCSSSSLSLNKALSASSSLTRSRALGWEVLSPEGSGCKEVSPP